MSTMKTVTCEHCKQSFERELRHYNQSKKLGRSHFCSISCASKHRIFKNPHLINNINPGKETDELSPFRRHWLSMVHRSKNKKLVLSIDLVDLKNQWKSQKGLCALSDLPMILPPSTASNPYKGSPYLASIDRIDPDKGYTVDNIQWVCLIGQYCKNIYSIKDVINFCNAVSKKVT